MHNVESYDSFIKNKNIKNPIRAIRKERIPKIGEILNLVKYSKKEEQKSLFNIKEKDYKFKLIENNFINSKSLKPLNSNYFHLLKNKEENFIIKRKYVNEGFLAVNDEGKYRITLSKLLYEKIKNKEINKEIKYLPASSEKVKDFSSNKILNTSPSQYPISKYKNINQLLKPKIPIKLSKVRSRYINATNDLIPKSKNLLSNSSSFESINLNDERIKQVDDFIFKSLVDKELKDINLIKYNTKNSKLFEELSFP